MLNQLFLVGRLVDITKIKKIKDKGKTSIVTLAVPRNFKNVDGKYDTDFIDCILYDGIAENTSENCHKGDILGIKGRVQTTNDKNAKNTEIVAEKVTFLTSSNKEKDKRN